MPRMAACRAPAASAMRVCSGGARFSYYCQPTSMIFLKTIGKSLLYTWYFKKLTSAISLAGSASSCVDTDGRSAMSSGDTDNASCPPPVYGSTVHADLAWRGVLLIVRHDRPSRVPVPYVPTVASSRRPIRSQEIKRDALPDRAGAQ